ncbi:hypothetical protein Tco_1503834 [Tanacetum coccineum]
MQEFTNHVSILQSQKIKLEEEKEDVEAEAAILKAQPSYPNVPQLTDLLVNSLKPEFDKPVKSYDFISFILTKLKDLPVKFEEVNGTLGYLKEYVEKLEIDVLADLKGIPNKKDKGKKVMSHEDIVIDEEYDSDSDVESRPSDTLEESSKSKSLKKFIYITESVKELEMDHNRPLEEQDLIIKLNMLARRKKKNMDDLHDYFKSTKRYKQSV